MEFQSKHLLEIDPGNIQEYINNILPKKMLVSFSLCGFLKKQPKDPQKIPKKANIFLKSGLKFLILVF